MTFGLNAFLTISYLIKNDDERTSREPLSLDMDSFASRILRIDFIAGKILFSRDPFLSFPQRVAETLSFHIQFLLIYCRRLLERTTIEVDVQI